MRPGELCRIVNAGLGSGRFCVVVGNSFNQLGESVSYEDYDVLLEGRTLRNINGYFLEPVVDEAENG